MNLITKSAATPPNGSPPTHVEATPTADAEPVPPTYAPLATPARLHVSHVHANFKSENSVELGPLTLITGPNHSCKSALLSAVVTGLTSRDDARGKQPKRLIKHAPGRDKRLFATLTLAQSLAVGSADRASTAVGRVEWATEKRGKGASTPDPRVIGIDANHAGLAVVLSREVKNILASEEKRRRALLRIISPPGLLDAVEKHLAGAYVETWKECRAAAESFVRKATSKGGDAEDASASDGEAGDDDDGMQATAPTKPAPATPVPLVEADVLTEAKKIAIKRERQERRIADAERGAQPAQAPAPEAIAELRQALVNAQTGVQRQRQATAARQRMAELDQQIAQATTQAMAAQAAAAAQQIQQGLPSLQHIEAIETVLAAQRIVVEAYPDGTGYCMGCRRPVPADRMQLAAQAAAADAEHAVGARQALQAAAQASGAAQTLSALQRSLNALQQERADAIRIFEGAERAGVATQEQLQAATAAVERATAAVALQTAWVDATRKAVAARESADAYKATHEAITKVMSESLDATVAGFCADGSEVLPEGDKLAIRLFDKGDEVCEVGLRRGAKGALIDWDGLSGQEKAYCVAAMCCAWADRQPAPVKLVAIDEVDFDAKSLSALCAGFKRVHDKGRGPSQVLIAKADVAVGAEPTGWNIVRMSEGDAR